MGEAATVAVIGAGSVGREIALAAALAGYRTILEDILPSSLRKAQKAFCTNLQEAVASGDLSAERAQSARGRLEYAQSVEEAARQADLVIEAVPEELESKLEIFILLDKICRPATILVTTSLETDVTQLATATYRTERCAGMRRIGDHSAGRFEVVAGQATSEETSAVVRALAANMSRHWSPAHLQ